MAKCELTAEYDYGIMETRRATWKRLTNTYTRIGLQPLIMNAKHVLFSLFGCSASVASYMRLCVQCTRSVFVYTKPRYFSLS